MKTLLLMRHAKSDWKQPGLSDHDRPLNARGRAAAPAIARKLLECGPNVDVILASSAVRVQETVALLQEQWSSGAELLTSPALYLASPQQIMSEVQSLHDTWHSALVVGHNPGMAALVCHLAAQDLEFPTGALAIFQFDTNTWSKVFSKGGAELMDFCKPRDLD